MNKLILTALLGLFCAGNAESKPRGLNFVNPISMDDGNFRVGIATTCPLASWSVVVSTRIARRKITLINVSGSGGPICLGTSVMSTDTPCNNVSHGIEIGTSAEYSDSSAAMITCRARAGSGTAILKGFETYDTGD